MSKTDIIDIIDTFKSDFNCNIEKYELHRIVDKNIKYNKKLDEYELSNKTNNLVYKRFLQDINNNNTIKKELKQFLDNEIETYKNKVLKSCRNCDKCNEISIDGLSELVYVNYKFVCLECSNMYEIDFNNFIRYFNNEIIDYQSFNFNDEYNKDIQFIPEEYQNKVAEIIHKHNIKIIRKNKSKFTKKQILDELDNYYFYSDDIY